MSANRDAWIVIAILAAAIVTALALSARNRKRR